MGQASSTDLVKQKHLFVDDSGSDITILQNSNKQLNNNLNNNLANNLNNNLNNKLNNNLNNSLNNNLKNKASKSKNNKVKNNVKKSEDEIVTVAQIIKDSKNNKEMTGKGKYCAKEKVMEDQFESIGGKWVYNTKQKNEKVPHDNGTNKMYGFSYKFPQTNTKATKTIKNWTTTAKNLSETTNFTTENLGRSPNASEVANYYQTEPKVENESKNAETNTSKVVSLESEEGGEGKNKKKNKREEISELFKKLEDPVKKELRVKIERGKRRRLSSYHQKTADIRPFKVEKKHREVKKRKSKREVKEAPQDVVSLVEQSETSEPETEPEKIDEEKFLKSHLRYLEAKSKFLKSDPNILKCEHKPVLGQDTGKVSSTEKFLDYEARSLLSPRRSIQENEEPKNLIYPKSSLINNEPSKTGDNRQNSVPKSLSIVDINEKVSSILSHNEEDRQSRLKKILLVKNHDLPYQNEGGFRNLMNELKNRFTQKQKDHEDHDIVSQKSNKNRTFSTSELDQPEKCFNNRFKSDTLTFAAQNNAKISFCKHESMLNDSDASQKSFSTQRRYRSTKTNPIYYYQHESKECTDDEISFKKPVSASRQDSMYNRRIRKTHKVNRQDEALCCKDTSDEKQDGGSDKMEDKAQQFCEYMKTKMKRPITKAFKVDSSDETCAEITENANKYYELLKESQKKLIPNVSPDSSKHGKKRSEILYNRFHVQDEHEETCQHLHDKTRRRCNHEREIRMCEEPRMIKCFKMIEEEKVNNYNKWRANQTKWNEKLSKKIKEDIREPKKQSCFIKNGEIFYRSEIERSKNRSKQFDESSTRDAGTVCHLDTNSLKKDSNTEHKHCEKRKHKRNKSKDSKTDPHRRHTLRQSGAQTEKEDKGRKCVRFKSNGIKFSWIQDENKTWLKIPV